MGPTQSGRFENIEFEGPKTGGQDLEPSGAFGVTTWSMGQTNKIGEQVRTTNPTRQPSACARPIQIPGIISCSGAHLSGRWLAFLRRRRVILGRKPLHAADEFRGNRRGPGGSHGDEHQYLLGAHTQLALV